MTVERPLGPWTLRCALSVSQNKRLCALEQTLTTKGGGLLWRLTLTEEEEQVLVFSGPADLDRSVGLSIGAGSFAGIIKDDEWSYQRVCIAVVRFDGLMQMLLLESQQIGMHYRTRAGKDVQLTAAMDGFEKALEEAGEDPFGKRPVKALLKSVPIPMNRPAGAADASTSE
ncbi:invasion associated locus B family protein [Ensifer sp. SL37]|uniref:invasion associated locus B family protein n=1 Tax=Ensifer sp. SL37 TaxID=2995137 RepID=UPI002273A540|nr:invasion associated locus B family protein [Ensifer sp. SL37]MCY1740996.1 invasion associated locus B family protein [Ensifer sp. SL37]